MQRSVAGRARRHVALAFAAALVGPLALAGPVAAVGIGSVTTLTIHAQPYGFVETVFEIHVSVLGSTTPSPCGALELYDDTSGTPVLVTSIDTNCGTSFLGTYTNHAGYDLGEHSFHAEFVPDSPETYEPSTSETETYTPVIYPDTFVDMLVSSSVEAHAPLKIQVAIGSGTTAFDVDATITITRNGTATPVCVIPVDPNNVNECTVSNLPVGTWSLTAVYSGNSWSEPGSSATYPVTVTPDTVKASGVGVSWTTFYPVTDGYRDTVTMKGTRNEPIDVVIKIYSPSGSMFKSQTFARATGAYAMTWNGRTATGTIRPEGTYKITQTLRDAFGTTQTFTSFVTLSKKKLYTLTKTTTKLATATSASGTEGTATISRNTTSGLLTLKPGMNGFAGAGWQFGLPSATIFKSITFKLYAKHGLGLGAQMGMQNFTWCPYVPGTDWDTSCFDRVRNVGNSSNTVAWYSTAGSVTANRSGAVVRGIIGVTGGTAYVYKAQLVVVYQVLKY